MEYDSLSAAILPISSMGSIVPISLFASMSVIRTVSGRIAVRRSSRFTRPSRSTGRTVRSMAFFARALHGSRTATCSIADVITCLALPGAAATAPRIAWLLDSVPPLVNMISATRAPTRAATNDRACSTAPRAFWPYAWIELALPYSSVRYGSMAARTSGVIGVVAL